jgi:hypothetical protein
MPRLSLCSISLAATWSTFACSIGIRPRSLSLEASIRLLRDLPSGYVQCVRKWLTPWEKPLPLQRLNKRFTIALPSPNPSMLAFTGDALMCGREVETSVRREIVNCEENASPAGAARARWRQIPSRVHLPSATRADAKAALGGVRRRGMKPLRLCQMVGLTITRARRIVAPQIVRPCAGAPW